MNVLYTIDKKYCYLSPILFQDNEGHIASDFDYIPPKIVAESGSTGSETSKETPKVSDKEL